MGTSLLTEPQVLAAAKNALDTAFTSESGYAVTDTQFSTSQWLDEKPISDEIIEQLAPFNHVRVGSGYPDLVGAGWFSDQFYRGERHDIDAPPLFVIEAKGYGSGEYIDTETGIIQAHDRLQEANVAFLAVPKSAVSNQVRSLSRELNIGVFGVTRGGSAELFEKPRIVGTQVGKEASTIRLQAGPQSVAHQSFRLNQPKNYLGYPLCVYHSGPTIELLKEHIVKDVDSARTGAAFLGLAERQNDGKDTLTPLGEEIVRFALQKHGSLDSALQEFKSWKNRQKRFIELSSDWALIARWVVFSYPATKLLVASLQQLQKEKEYPTLPDLIEHIYDHSPTFAIEFFIRNTSSARTKVLTDEGLLNRSNLNNTNVYRSVTTYQFKQMLYHTGILSNKGKDTSRLEPSDSIWSLEQHL